MRYRVVKDADGQASLYVDGEFDMAGDEDAIDERLWTLYGTADSAEAPESAE